jgi:hypothetical protein
MAGVTLIGAVDMAGVLATRCHTIVAIDAITHECRVIRSTTGTSGGREPGACCMADIAFIHSNKMRWAFACGDNAVMAGRAHTVHFPMIDR